MPTFLRWILRLGPTNPVAVRIVHTGSRRTRHLYIRAAYLAVLIVVLLWALLFNTRAGELSYRDLALAGAASFTYIAYLQIALICIIAPVFMAGAIAQEANPQNWDIMLTTPLSASEIVLGNLFGRLFFILALLFASLPLFALTQYFGGVPGESIFTSYLVAGCAALLVGSIAIALSVSRLVGKRAVFTFYVSVVSYLAVTIGVDLFLRGAGQGAAGGSGVTIVTALNPFLALNALLNPTGYPRAPEGSGVGLAAFLLERPVTAWCTLSAGLSVLLMIVSVATVRAGGIAGLGGLGGRSSGAAPWYRRLFGLGAAGSEYRPPRAVWNNPIAWREAAARNATFGRIISRWLFIAGGAAFGVALIYFFHTGTLNHTSFRQVLLITLMAELGVITLVAINMSATAVSREREDGTLDLLLTTAITPANYLWGKLRGLIAYLMPLLAVPLGTLALASIYVLVGGFGRSGGVTLRAPVLSNTITTPVVLPEAAVIAPLVAVPFIAFCVIIGLQWSLKSKGTLSSVVSTVGVVGVISGVVGLCGLNSAANLPLLGPFLGAMSPASVIFACIYPENGLTATISSTSMGLAGFTSARTFLVLGSLIAAGVYAAIVYGVHTSMVRNFDTTVRRLAGTR